MQRNEESKEPADHEHIHFDIFIDFICDAVGLFITVNPDIVERTILATIHFSVLSLSTG